MNQKRIVGAKRYKSPVSRDMWERSEEYQLSPRVTLKKGTVVKVKGQRAATFTFQYAERNVETGAVTLAFVGGKAGRVLDRFFRPESITKVVRR